MGTNEQQQQLDHYKHMLSVEQTRSKGLLRANQALQMTITRSETTIKVSQAQAFAAQQYLNHCVAHLNIIASILARNGNTTDLISDN